jgi:hypothetical protein
LQLCQLLFRHCHLCQRLCVLELGGLDLRLCLRELFLKDGIVQPRQHRARPHLRPARRVHRDHAPADSER